MNKQIIIRLVISFVFIAFALRVLIPIIMTFLKRKLSSQSSQSDIDWMIKKQQDQLRAQYGITNPTGQKQSSKESTPPNTAITSYLKEVSQNISHNFSYTVGENKIQNFLTGADRRKIINFLSSKNQQNPLQKINFLSQALLVSLLTDEIIKKNFTMSQVFAKKLSISLYELSMGVQIKILLHMKETNRTEEQVFSENYILHTFPEDQINFAIDSIIQKESNLWAHSPSLLFEELSLYFHFASIVEPLPDIKNKADKQAALIILGCKENEPFDIIKKKYKKMALEKHPDKIMAQKLPPKLEKKGIDNFKKIQEAYEILSQEKS